MHPRVTPYGLLRSSWAILALSWAYLAAYPEAILGHLGRSLGHLLGHLVLSLGHLGLILAPSGPHNGQKCAHATVFLMFFALFWAQPGARERLGRLCFIYETGVPSVSPRRRGQNRTPGTLGTLRTN